MFLLSIPEIPAVWTRNTKADVPRGSKGKTFFFFLLLIRRSRACCSVELFRNACIIDTNQVFCFSAFFVRWLKLFVLIVNWHCCGNWDDLHQELSLLSSLSLYLFLHALQLLHLWWQDFRKQINCEMDQRFHVSSSNPQRLYVWRQTLKTLLQCHGV